jgi:hypothetical protein
VESESLSEPFPDTLYAYFGSRTDVAGEFELSGGVPESRFLVTLHYDEDRGRTNENQWASRESDDEKTFGGFYARFWGVADLELTLLKGNDYQAVRLSNGEVAGGSLPIKYDNWRSHVYKRILEQFAVEQKADVTAPIKGLASLKERSRKAFERSGESRLVELYILLEDVLEEFLRTARAVLQRPASRLKHEPEHVDFAGEDLSGHHHAQGSARALSVERVRKMNFRSVPVAFTRMRSRNSHDIPENRFLLSAISDVGSKIDEVIDYQQKRLEPLKDTRQRFEDRRPGDKYKKSQHWKNVDWDIERREKVLRQLKDSRRGIADLGASLRRLGVGQRKATSAESEIFYYDPRYARLRTLRAKIDRSLEGGQINSETVEFTLGAFSKLYARWCFHKIVGALQDIGFEAPEVSAETLSRRQPEEDEKYCTMKYGDNSSLRVDVWYERRYKFFSEEEEKQHDSGRPRYYDPDMEHYGFMYRDASRGFAEDEDGEDENNYDHRPDISLEFWHPNFLDGRFPLILTFDPTTSRGKKQR